MSRDEVLARYPALDLARLVTEERQPREWVIDGLCPAGASIAVVGRAGGGKSLLVLAASINIAAGRNRFAGLIIPKPRNVLYIDTENTEDDVYERVTDLGVTRATDLRRLHFLHLPSLPPLDRDDGGRELAAIVAAYNLQRGDVVVLDSTQRVTQGPENDADTWRAFYRATGQGLKRHGLTVIRTDNTGKDESRGSRGSSGKRDDVDVSWILTTEGDRGQYLTLHPEKARIPDVHPIAMERLSRPDGTIGYTTARDPRQVEITALITVLDRLGLANDAGVRPCRDALKIAGEKVSNDILRDAVRARKGVPNRLGTPLPADRAEHARHTTARPMPIDISPQVNGYERCAG